MTRMRVVDFLGPVSGILFSVLAVIAGALGGSVTVDLDEPSTAIADALEEASDRTTASFFLFGLALIFFTFFIAYLVERCRRALAGSHWLIYVLWAASLLFGAAYLILGFAQAAQFSILDYGTEPELAKALYALGWNSIFLLSPPMMVFGAAVALLSFIYRALPIWLGVGGILIFLGGILPWWGVFIFTLWILAASITWLVTLNRPAANMPMSTEPPAGMG